MDKLFSYILMPSLTVLAGGLIYILFRPTEAVFLSWFSTLGIDSWLGAVRGSSVSVNSLLPNWMIYSLPNGLWAFAYTLIILRIWKGSNSIMKCFWYISIPVLVFGFEVLQYTGDLPGTFCRCDLLWGVLGINLGFLFVYRINYNLNLSR